MPRRAKIVCTLGPATATAERVAQLVEAGMDIARLNFSHGTHADHARSYRLVREASDATGRAVGILADLQGPKIRLGRFAPGLSVVWQPGDVVVITTEDVVGTADRVSTTYAALPTDVVPGHRLLVDDGKLALEVLEVAGPEVRCRVVEGGPVSDHKGLSVPGVALSVPALSEKDIADLKFALSLRVDWIALSFVRAPQDAVRARELMTELGEKLPLIAKLERPEAVERLPQIVDAFDAIMVATQMLDSMIENSRPTRAEASDVANAVLDGADAVMLSGETSVGRYPIESVRTMARIIETVNSGPLHEPPLLHAPHTMGGTISKAAKEVGESLGAKALCCFTVSGDTVRRMARFHSTLPLLAFTPEPAVRSQLALTWGVEKFLSPYVEHTDEMVAQVQDILLSLGRVEIGRASC